MWYIHTIEYYSTIYEALKLATTWMKLENIILSERRQLQKNYYIIHSNEISRICKSRQTKSRTKLPRAEIRGMGNGC